MTSDLAKFAKDKGVKYFMISYTDLFGGQRAKLVPAEAIADMQEDGAGFAGFATWLDLTPAHPDMLAVPDPASVIQLPWQRDVAWVAANCVMDGKDLPQAPRNVLRRLIAEAAAEGMHVKTGIEAEFFLLTPEGIFRSGMAPVPRPRPTSLPARARVRPAKWACRSAASISSAAS